MTKKIVLCYVLWWSFFLECIYYNFISALAMELQLNSLLCSPAPNWPLYIRIFSFSLVVCGINIDFLKHCPFYDLFILNINEIIYNIGCSTLNVGCNRTINGTSQSKKLCVSWKYCKKHFSFIISVTQFRIVFGSLNRCSKITQTLIPNHPISFSIYFVKIQKIKTRKINEKK